MDSIYQENCKQKKKSFEEWKIGARNINQMLIKQSMGREGEAVRS